MKVTQEMVHAAIKEAVHQGLLPKFAQGEAEYLKMHNQIQAVLQAALIAQKRVEPGWVPVTEALLNAQEPWLYEPMWIALKGGRVVTGRYEWRQGRNPDRFYADGAGDYWAYDASHVAPFTAPASPEKTLTAEPA